MASTSNIDVDIDQLRISSALFDSTLLPNIHIT